VLERLEQAAARAREEQWPYEQFLETLLEAEVWPGDVYTVRTDGTGLKRLTTDAKAISVAWSSRGRLAFYGTGTQRSRKQKAGEPGETRPARCAMSP
jgi:hypothetical protein